MSCPESRVRCAFPLVAATVHHAHKNSKRKKIKCKVTSSYVEALKDSYWTQLCPANPWKVWCCHSALHKQANSIFHKPPSQLRFSLPSIIITITSNEPWNTKTHKTDRNPPITNHKPWPFEPVKVKFCFLKRSAKMIDGTEKRNR